MSGFSEVEGGLGAILRVIPDTVLVVDVDDRIAYINHVMEGYDAAQVIGSPAVTYIQPDFQDEFLDLVREVRTHGTAREYEVAVSGPSGERTWWASRISAITAGEVVWVVIVSSNVTGLRAAAAAKEAAEAELRKVNRLLPICAWCRRVREDDGYWEELERYLGKERGTTITHGICPRCLSAIARQGTIPDDETGSGAA
jgi:PAS domain S-box-containing protein